MNAVDRITHSIEVGNFDRIALHVNNVENEVVIQQGEHEALTIEARPDVFARLKTEVRDGQLTIQLGGSWSDKISAALATSLTRLRIKYIVTVKNLTGLDITGLAHVRADNITTNRLQVKFGGLGNLHIARLNAHRLDIDVTMPSPCEIEVAGRVEEQSVSLSGMGEYDARALDSRTATVALKGPGGHAIVRVEDELTVSISGPGRVEYYGQPRVTKRVSPMGVVAHLIEIAEVAAR
jgi:Putative auto-transporter adhesin, head GIN domain